jgi:hypothetical protein
MRMGGRCQPPSHPRQGPSPRRHRNERPSRTAPVRLAPRPRLQAGSRWPPSHRLPDGHHGSRHRCRRHLQLRPVAVLGADPNHPHRGQEKRRREDVAEQLNGQIALGGRAQHPGYQAPAIEGSSVGALGVFISSACRDVGPSAGRHRCLGSSFQLRGRHGELGNDPGEPGKVDLGLQIAEVRHPINVSAGAQGPT